MEWDPALLRNTSHRMEYILGRILYYAYTMYIPKIYIVYPKGVLYIYTKYILGIYKGYIIYILGIYNVYTKDNHVVYTMNILGIYLVYQIPTGICMVYTWYVHGIMGLFRTFFYNDIPLIHYVYPKDIHIITKLYHYKKGTEQTHEV